MKRSNLLTPITQDINNLPIIVMEYAVMIDNFQAEGPTELTVRRGDFVQVLYQMADRWAYVCRQIDKAVGYVPYLYCAFIKAVAYGGNKNARYHHHQDMSQDHPPLSSSSHLCQNIPLIRPSKNINNNNNNNNNNDCINNINNQTKLLKVNASLFRTSSSSSSSNSAVINNKINDNSSNISAATGSSVASAGSAESSVAPVAVTVTTGSSVNNNFSTMVTGGAGSCSSGRSSSTDAYSSDCPTSNIPTNLFTYYRHSIRQYHQQHHHHPYQSSASIHRGISKARSDPDGGSWGTADNDDDDDDDDDDDVDDEGIDTDTTNKLSDIVRPPSPYNSAAGAANSINMSHSQSFSDKILATKPCSVTPTVRKRSRASYYTKNTPKDDHFCEPYKTIVHELEDCLEKLTLV